MGSPEMCRWNNLRLQYPFQIFEHHLHRATTDSAHCTNPPPSSIPHPSLLILRSQRDSYNLINAFHVTITTAEDNLNISLKDITVTGRDGRVSQLDQVYIRGSMIRFFIVPDMLQNAPMYVLFQYGFRRRAIVASAALPYTLTGQWPERLETNYSSVWQVQARRSQCDEGKGYWYGSWSRHYHAR